jgi:PTS system ascorbate-specific IIB component
MAKYKVGVCCTFGAGSSLMLKMNLDTVFRRMGLDADVQVYDISSVKSMAPELDAVYTSSALAPQVEDSVIGTEAVVVPVVNYFDLNGLESLTKQYLKK